MFRGGSQSNDELLEDAKAYGVILPDQVQEPAVYRLWPEHLDVVDLFLRCMTQWRTTADGLIGLDYGVVLQMGQLYGISDMPSVMEDLQLLELRVRELINAERRKG